MEPKTHLNVCKVVYFDELGRKERVEYCLAQGKTFSAAANELVQYFGNENIISMEIFPLLEGALPISQSVAELLQTAEDSADIDGIIH